MSSVTNAAITASLVILLAPVPVVVAGEPIVSVVDDDGHGSRRDCDSDRPTFSRIQPAIDAGPGGQPFSDVNRVIVCPGVYRETLTIGADMPGVSLEAATQVRPVIEPPLDSPASSPVAVVYANRLRVQGFRIRPTRSPGSMCGGPTRTLVEVQFAHLTVVDSRFGPDPGASACSAYGRAILVFGDEGSPGFYGAVSVYGSTIAGFGQTGVDVFGPSLMTIDGNRFEPRERDADSTADVAAIRFDQSPTLDGPAATNIRGNLIEARHPSGDFVAITGSTSDAVTIVDNVVIGATRGIRVTAAGGSIHDNSLSGRGRDAGPGTGIVLRGAGDLSVRGNVATRFGGSGIRVVSTTDADIFDNDFRGNRGMDCVDTTTGSGDAGTANHWTGNSGYEAQPTTICT